MKNKLLLILIFMGMIGYTIMSDDGPSSSSGTGGTNAPAAENGYAARSLEIARTFLSSVPSHDTRIDAVSAWGASEENETVGLETNALRRNYYIVFDGSGSMNETRCAPDSTKALVSQDALTAFIDGMPSDANLGLFIFDIDGASERVALGSGNADLVRGAVSRSTPSGATPLGRSLVSAVEALSDQARRQRGYGEYHIVVITDGAASDESAMNEMVDYILSSTPITVHTIGFCIRGNHALNRPGRMVYRAAGNPDELRRGLEQVLAETEDFNAQSFE